MDKFNQYLKLLETTWNSGFGNIILDQSTANANIDMGIDKKTRGARHKAPIIRDFGSTSKGERKHVRTIAKSNTLDASKKSRIENMVNNKVKTAILLTTPEYNSILSNYKTIPEKGKVKQICRMGPFIYWDENKKGWILNSSKPIV